MNKSAKEMFEEFGLVQFMNEHIIQYELKPIVFPNTIIFHITFNRSEKKIYMSGQESGITISFDFYKAIQQQLKELGWLDE